MIINYEGVDYDCDDELSFRDFTGWIFTDRPEYDFSNKIIYGSQFSNETVDAEIFSPDTVNVTFIKCHLNNVMLPGEE